MRGSTPNLRTPTAEPADEMGWSYAFIQILRTMKSLLARQSPKRAGGSPAPPGLGPIA